MTQHNDSGPFTTLRPLVLGSGSPRRRELLADLGLAFEIMPSNGHEPPPVWGESPVEYARRMAHLKTLDVAHRAPDKVVLGADTIVVLGDRIMGKPASPADALGMLTALSGKTHQVITGCCIVLPGEDAPVTMAVSTDVTMRESTQAELAAYVATNEPMDKAGAYAIQGKGTFLVREISGSYTNVVGLPLSRVLDVLLDRGVVVPRQG